MARTATVLKKTTVKKPASKAAIKPVKAKKPTVNGLPSIDSVRSMSADLKLVSDPTRLLILMGLAQTERNVGDICTICTQSQPAVSHHLSLLRVSRLVDNRRNGKSVIYSLSDRGQRLLTLINDFLTGSA